MDSYNQWSPVLHRMTSDGYILGTIAFPNLDVFLENFQGGVVKGGRVISDPKNVVADFCGNFVRNFR